MSGCLTRLLDPPLVYGRTIGSAADAKQKTSYSEPIEPALSGYAHLQDATNTREQPQGGQRLRSVADDKVDDESYDR